jgi:hypothetical protein
MTVTETAFRQAALDPDAPVPAGLVGPGGTGAGRRFDVYRNNVAVGLTEALEAAFPSVRGHVGTDFFAAMAGVFLRAHPPDTPVLWRWGDRLPGFIETFPPLVSLPWLADVARLEIAIRASYHAADARPADPARLAGIAPDRLGDARLRLAPAVRLVRSRWPVFVLWRAGLGGPLPDRDTTGQNVLVTRPGFDPLPWVLPPGGGLFLERLLDGAPLAEATGAAAAAVATFDPGEIVTRLLSQRAITDINLPEASPCAP